MPKTILHDLMNKGQSVWLDYICRSLIDSGRLKSMIDQGVRGVTSNPSIFNNAVSKSTEYDEYIKDLARAGKTTFQIYDDLTIRDIQDAADIFFPTWKQSDHTDGYISLEINPTLAYNTDQTIEEGMRLWNRVDRPNLMLKVPATDQGFPAVTALTSKGCNINVTLIFSLQQYMNSAQAYFKGIEQSIASGGNPSTICSVASVFVSRVDTLVDIQLEELINAEYDEDAINTLENMRGKAAIANAAAIYQNFCDMQNSKRFLSLRAQGARLQRIVWGSTSTKNPDYSDTKYVTELIAAHTINTIPEKTLEAFLGHGTAEDAMTTNTRKTHRILSDLNSAGIDIKEVCATLLSDGVAAFEKAFNTLLESIEKKAKN